MRDFWRFLALPCTVSDVIFGSKKRVRLANEISRASAHDDAQILVEEKLAQSKRVRESDLQTRSGNSCNSYIRAPDMLQEIQNSQGTTSLS